MTCCVIDEAAETRSVREFKAAHTGKVYGCWYNESQKGRYRWNLPEYQVFVNRTESLDASHREIVSGEVEFPRKDEVFERLILPQMLNLVRVVQVDDTTGARKARWIVRGTKRDHLRHAHNYARIALERVGMVKKVTKARRPSRWSLKRPKGFMSR